MKHKDKSHTSHDEKASPYRVPAAASAPTRLWVRTGPGSGAIMVFVAVIAPAAIGASYTIARSTLFGLYDRRAMATILYGLGLPLNVLAVPVGLLLAVGAYRLTGGPRGEPISDELKATTRLAVIAYALALVLTLVTLVSSDRIGYRFFDDAAYTTRTVAEALLALTAARHLAYADARAAAMAARALAAALPAGLVAQYFLTRWTHDALWNPIPPAHDDLVLPMNIGLWVGRVVVFALLWRVLARAGGAPSPQAA